MKTRTLAATVVLSVLTTWAGASAAETAGETEEKIPHRVPRVSGPVKVDARLDENAWQEALVMGVNTEVRPSENVPAPVQTDMLLAYSETHFYVAFRAYDPDPSRIRARLCDRDRMWDDEWVVIGIDTYNDQRGGFEFACNPLGIQGDTASGVHGDGNAWDAIWDSAGRITEEGYVVEMAIPFSSLRFQHTEGDQIWGVDAVRSYPRDVRHHIGLYARDRDNNCYYCQMEKLIGFAGATPGRNIELDPTFSTIASQEREDFTEGEFKDPDTSYDPGLTARWGITPNVTLSAAANPDFSQVEADAMQLDVNTRYALWYPEKRPFFLEGAGIFAGFYSRSIADPAWGAKVTGKGGKNGFGALVARDEVTNIIFPGSESSRSTSLDMETTATVLRYRRDVGEQSCFDVGLSSREGEDYYNRMGGATAEIWFTDAVSFEALALTSRTSYPDSVVADFDQPAGELSDEAYSLSLGRYTSGLDVYVDYESIGKDFRSDLDFFPGVGYSEIEAGFGYTWQEDADNWWTMLNFGSAYDHETEEDGSLRSKGARFWANYQGQKESFADLRGWLGQNTYAGEEFDTWNLNYDAGFWPTGSLFVMIDGVYGETIDYANVQPGKILEIAPRAQLTLGDHLSAELRHVYERLDVDEGRLYTANLSYLKAVYQFNSRAFLRAIVQYADIDHNTDLYVDDVDPEYEGLWSQILLSYKINPQTVLFLGYSDGHYGDQDVDLTQTDRTFFAKIGYAWVL